jgi:hypothetical protein
MCNVLLALRYHIEDNEILNITSFSQYTNLIAGADRYFCM